MSVREELVQQIQGLTDDQVRQVADYLSFVKYQSRFQAAPRLDEKQLAALYGEFAEEDRELAEEGMAAYQAGLLKEDQQ